MKNSAIIVVFLLLVGVSWGRGAATDDVIQPAQFNVFPESILLGEGEERDITWVIHNPNNKELSIQGIRPLSAEGIELLLPSRQSNEALFVIAGLSDLALAVKIRRAGEIPNAQKAYLQFDCLIDGIKRTALDYVTISPKAAPPVEKIATLSVESKLESINEHRPGWVYLVLTNKSNQPIKIGPTKLLAPNFVDSSSQLTESHILAGQDTKIIPVEIHVTGTVQPGSQLLVFDVTVMQIQNGKEHIYHLTQKHPVAVGIIGESEILKVLQIPSFLVLPGALAVLTIGLLWQLFSESSKKDKFPLTFKNENFWLVAITISMGIAFIYPHFTQWCLNERRDYLYGYGLKDVVWVWLLGIGVGLLACIIFTLGLRMYRLGVRLHGQLKERKVRKNYPTAQDSPKTLLRKLHKQGLTMELKKVLLKDDKEFFLLQKCTPHATKYWVSSGVQISLPHDDTAIDKVITEQLRLKGSLDVLLLHLKKGNVKTLEQETPPMQVEKSDIKKYLPKEVFISIALKKGGEVLRGTSPVTN